LPKIDGGQPEANMSSIVPFIQPNPSRPSGVALEARGLSIARGRRMVVRDATLSLAAGEIVLLLGANGAGKTTLLQGLAGLLRPTSGEVLWLGEPLSQSPAARRRLGFLSHESGLYPDLTVRENLLFAGRMYGAVDVARRAGELLAAAGLESKAGQPTHRLSQGMRKRLAIARAVVHEPSILLLDEPFANLDEEHRAWLMELLESLQARGTAICFTSHDADSCRSMARRIICLQAGALLADDGHAGYSALERLPPISARA
jgi:heme ABC exporter ATP-binding subunit CcmA